MALVRIMLGTAQIYLKAGEKQLARKEMQRALEVSRRMRSTRKVRIMRAYIAQGIEAL